ncbi:MAG: hypothetical protein IKR86_05480 [Candidatus Methanomethylophilaceae archaeon]|nr:hypothetical protein [Candidatus Methanomethylophilaceae archaeon]
MQLKSAAWPEAVAIGSDAYFIAKGDTAVFSFNSFAQDVPAWERYMKDGGELPDDTIGNFFRAANKASQGPAI